MDERQRRSIAVSVVRSLLAAALLIAVPLATAAVISILTFVIALLTVPFLPQVTAVVAASAVVLLFVKWINRFADPRSANWRVAIIRICGGVVAAFGGVVAFSLRNLEGHEGAIAVVVGLLVILMGVAIVATHPLVSHTEPNDDTSKDCRPASRRQV